MKSPCRHRPHQSVVAFTRSICGRNDNITHKAVIGQKQNCKRSQRYIGKQNYVWFCFPLTWFFTECQNVWEADNLQHGAVIHHIVAMELFSPVHWKEQATMLRELPPRRHFKLIPLAALYVIRGGEWSVVTWRYEALRIFLYFQHCQLNNFGLCVISLSFS